MSPEGKTPKPVRRKSAGLVDNASGGEGYLDGQLLIAMPVMGDPRFVFDLRNGREPRTRTVARIRRFLEAAQ